MDIPRLIPPSGIRSCCGYEDCRDKECQYRRTATNQKGEKVSCCGIEECGNIEYGKTYEEPDPNAKQFRTLSGTYMRVMGHGGSNGCTYRYEVTTADVVVGQGGKVKVTTGVATKIPQNCSQTSVENYDGINYYHYQCKTAISSSSNAYGGAKILECHNSWCLVQTSCKYKGRSYNENSHRYEEKCFEYNQEKLEAKNIKVSIGRNYDTGIGIECYSHQL